MAKILDGRVVRDKFAADLKRKIAKLDQKPTLAIVQIGNLAQSSAYIRQKKLFGEKIGAKVTHLKFSATIAQSKLIKVIEKLNKDRRIDGIIIQLPIPRHLNKSEIIETILPEKDVDGLHSKNVKKLWTGEDDGLIGATPRGILNLIKYYRIPIRGKRAVVVGRSALVGRPTAALLLKEGATITTAHRQTKDLAAQTRQADLLVVAAGVPNLIGSRHVKKGQVIVDVGINLIAGRPSSKKNKKITKLQEEISAPKMVGDVDFKNVSKIVKAISPVPGGVGPMTVAALFQNLVETNMRKIEKGNKRIKRNR
ncbi:MAG TPA: bifunctional 5,10-methylenetetrahydrofolate dehydrogenase/5,10-methenyltetrahydrofolate cyclohydrolase [Candidatus Paceibacterota bacterium]|nr:bifunctional 5,10-methylenetetrahydrofolate dehydrogenase/5,10-methenyltetrahydrofolate cyclohydrolase [Candidatus Paceibacterota bacterium]